MMTMTKSCVELIYLLIITRFWITEEFRGFDTRSCVKLSQVIKSTFYEAGKTGNEMLLAPPFFATPCYRCCLFKIDWSGIVGGTIL